MFFLPETFNIRNINNWILAGIVLCLAGGFAGQLASKYQYGKKIMIVSLYVCISVCLSIPVWSVTKKYMRRKTINVELWIIIGWGLKC